MQFSTTVRNALMDQIETTVGASAVIRLFDGSIPVNCAAPDRGTKIAEFDFASSWSLPATDGLLRLANLPLSTDTLVAGKLSYFRLYDSSGTVCHLQGTITAMAGDGDMRTDAVDKVAGQNLKVWTAAISAPGE